MFMAKSRQVSGIVDYTDELLDSDEPTGSNDSQDVKVQVRQSPYIDAFYTHHPIRLTIDSGVTGNTIRASTAKVMCATITASSQSAHQADGSSPLKVVVETRMMFTRDGHDLYREFGCRKFGH
jgi:hypothetical protein